MAEDPHDAVPQTVIFLRMAAAQMRQIAASSVPGTAQQLRHMPDQCEVRQGNITGRFGVIG